MFTRVSSAVESVELKPRSSESADQLKMGNFTQTGGNTTEPKDPAQEAPAAAAIKNNKMKKKGIRGFIQRTRRTISNAVLCCVRGDIEDSEPLGVQAKTQDEVDPSKQKNIKAPTIVISYPCSDSVDLQPCSSSQSGNKLSVSMGLPDPQPAPVSDSSNHSLVSESGSVPGLSGLHLKPDSDLAESVLNGLVKSDISMSFWLDLAFELTTISDPISQEISISGPSSIETTPDVDPAGPEPTLEHHQELFSDPGSFVDLQPRSSSHSGIELSVSMDMPGPQPAPGSDSSNLSSVSGSGSVQESSSLETEPGSNPPVEEKPDMGQTELESSLVPGLSNLSLVSESGSVPGPSSLKTKPGSNPSVKKKHDRGQTELKPSPVPGPTTGSFASFYSLQEMLGQGASGTVYEAVRKSDGQKVAVKFVKKSSLGKHMYSVLPEYSRPLYSEVAVNLVLRKPPASPYIVKMLDWFEEPERHVMVMEYPHPCKTLRNFILNKRGSLDETIARGLFRQAVLGVKHCIDRGVGHGDISLANMLVNTEAMQLKLIDFGCSYFFKGNAKKTPFEVISLGFLLQEMVQLMCSHTCPVSRECRDLVTRCMDSERFKRPTLDEILEDKWLKQD